ncbi:TPA: carbon starvation protein A [Clostridium botulinum]|uniref:Carbon starvation protein CstA n=1 Tax=Clostridium botulinum B str. Osaka05 TaxID=1407017 RepID=A0A0S6U2D3_CLOBO|nr:MULTISPECIES: carbon starvation protein A [Clostridium]AUM94455.1 carbon starvation protein A [Clostridium sporogenes]AVQ51883.1 carbon starvation protein A [Clostridium botulinum]GAE01045.1 carbon starvation protein CstA [Clostridium botulinum B str. Osaka05]HBJ2615276.1 carbon starvation protein A [Clostridium botulinum]
MNSVVLLLTGIILFLIAYLTYGRWLAKHWGIDISKQTPAHTKFDNVDYCPADAKILLGHHFSSIAGAGPIAGPIQASIFGWVPVMLWIVIGSIFIGGVHDFGSLFASIRHGGNSIGEIIRVNIGEKGKKLFNIFAWVTLVLVVAAFTDICASTFAYNPQTPELLTGARSGTASILFIFLAMGFGFFVYRRNAPVGLSTVVGVALLFFCIYIGYRFPVLKLSKFQWQIVLLIYITAASTMPVWLLLQPRDYLCSFLLYAMLIGAFIGILVLHPTMQLEATTSFTVKGQTLFPFLFVTVACGAVSGFHSLVSSGTSSKQLNSEKDTQLIGYGSMLIEGVVAIIALIAVGYVAKAKGTPAEVFANGCAAFMNSFGIPLAIGKVFVTLSFSAFALTSLDTATRIGRYIFQEFFQGSNEKEGEKKSVFTNMYVSTLITVFCALGLLLYGYEKIWPIFGSANQLLAALALLSLTAWLSRRGKKTIMIIIPMIFMFAVTLSALFLIIKSYLFGAKPNYILGVMAVILLVLAIILAVEAYNTLNKNKKANTNLGA